MTGAPITFAATAQQLAENRWRPFPGLQASKSPAMRGWPGLNQAEWDGSDLEAAITDYLPTDDYCCCLAVQREIVAIDLDIVDQKHAAAAAGLANEILGDTPLVRIGLAPKQIRVYRNSGAILIPFAQQIAAQIEPLMVRFRRDVGSLFNFIKASAILHQAQRQVDAQGRVVATIADYALAYPVFTKVMAQSSGKSVPDNVREVVKLIAELASSLPTKPTKGKFQRTATAGPGSEVVISSEQIGTATGIGKSAAYRAIRAALDLGFLANNETRQGKPFRLTLKQGLDEAGPPLLPDPKTITQESGAA